MIAQEEPQLVRKIILAGTGPAGGTGIDKVTSVTIRDMVKAALTLRHPEYYLFFTESWSGRNAAREFLARLNERTERRDKRVSIAAFIAQLKAIHAWGRQRPADLSRIHHPVLVANGDHDKMVPSSNSVDLARRLPNAELVLYEDAGHGGVFQYHEAFVKKALEFLEGNPAQAGVRGRSARPRRSTRPLPPGGPDLGARALRGAVEGRRSRAAAARHGGAPADRAAAGGERVSGVAGVGLPTRNP